MEKVNSPLTSFYDEWLSAQKSLISNWMNIQKSFIPSNGNGNSSKTFADPVSTWKEWMELQSNMVQQFSKAVSGMGGAPDSTAVPLKDWADYQTNAMNTYLDLFKQYANTVNGGEKSIELLKQFNDFQARWMQNMIDQAQSFPNYTFKNPLGFSTDIFGLYDKWREVYSSALGSMGQSVNSLFAGPQSEILRDTLSNVMNSSTSFLKVFEYLMPIYKAIQQNSLSLENYKQFLEPGRYKEILDRVFEFSSPQSMQEFYDLVSKVQSSMNATVQKGMQKLSELVEKNATLMPGLVNGDPSIAMKMYENILLSYQKSLEPIWKVPVEGRQVEIFSILNEISEKYSKYATLTTQYQYIMYKTGQDALESMVQKVASNVKDGVEIKSFNELFRVWVDTNENNFINLFNTEEFARLQGELVELGLAIKGDFQKIMELNMADYPIAPRSEIDELAKTIHTLDNKVHRLEKELEAYKEPKAAAKKAPVKVEN